MAVVLLASALLVGMGLYSLKTGTLFMRGRFEKEYAPVTYWFGTVFYLVSGTVFLGMMLFKYFTQP